MSRAWSPNSIDFLILNYLGEYDNLSLKKSIDADVKESAKYYNISEKAARKSILWMSNAAFSFNLRKLENEKLIVAKDDDYQLTDAGKKQWEYLKAAFKNNVISPNWTSLI